MGDQGPAVLVVDDDDDVRDCAVDIFEELGYRVIATSNGEEALDVLRARWSICLLFTDVVMPRMNGYVLADEARKLRPDLPVIFTSGYVKELPTNESGPFLSK